MGGAAVEGDPLPGGRLDAGDDADLPVLLGQHGPLLDMAFEVGVRRVEADRALTLEPDALELVAEPVALGIGEPIGMVETQPSGRHRGAEHVRAEPDSLLLRPGRDDDRTAGRSPASSKDRRTASPPRTPRHPSKAPAVATVSMCEPMRTGASSGSCPSLRPKIVPIS